MHPLSRTVWTLGVVSLFMDISSEMIHALLPVFLTTTLGASVALVGLIDGVAESTASISKVYSGYLSDRIGRRKPLILAGYALGALTKPLFAIAGSPSIVLGARFADRIGKGLRGAPRDALIADVAPIEVRGRAYSLRQAMDTACAFIGPLFAIVLLALFAEKFRAVFWVAVISALIAVALIMFGVKEEAASHHNRSRKAPIAFRDLDRLDRAFWSVALIGVVLTFARFSEAFLLLKAHAEGLPVALAPAVLVAMNVVYSQGAYSAGVVADRTSPRTLLLLGIAALVMADLLLGFGSGLASVFAGVGLWGAHMALTQGLIAKLVAERTPSNLIGSGFGLYDLATGLALLAASVVAGVLWDCFGPGAAFAAGGAFAVAAAALVLTLGRARTAQ
jgi:MFS family permease